MFSEGKFRKYFWYAIGEILLVVIGILIALSINTCSTNQDLRRTELKIYENLKSQINEDRIILESVVDYNNVYLEQFKRANQIIENEDRSQIDTLALIATNLYRYSDFNRSGNIYQNLVNSGDLKLLQNRDIIDAVQSLEEQYIYVNRLEENHFSVIMQFIGPELFGNVNFSTLEIERPEEIYSFKFQNLLLGFVDIMTEKDQVYLQALEEMEVITGLIDQELETSR